MTDSPARLLAFPARDDDRLRLALRGLVAALEAQGEAVAALRGELSEPAQQHAGAGRLLLHLPVGTGLDRDAPTRRPATRPGRLERTRR